jgi:predicted small lipoprotein YifL
MIMRLPVLLLCLLMCGCGQRGDLYLPDPAPEDAASEAAQDEKKSGENES